MNNLRGLVVFWTVSLSSPVKRGWAEFSLCCSTDWTLCTKCLRLSDICRYFSVSSTILNELRWFWRYLTDKATDAHTHTHQHTCLLDSLAGAAPTVPTVKALWTSLGWGRAGKSPLTALRLSSVWSGLDESRLQTPKAGGDSGQRATSRARLSVRADRGTETLQTASTGSRRALSLA